ncbi:hypothetical protein ACFSAG_00660 [Sphingorhabdus buctiana]|uniref:Uncharacterized protein n=1 Tax=Sphingorhabdus buctiana TaxID=1508805 RepID=A0ABW4M8I6_9SPHN
MRFGKALIAVYATLCALSLILIPVSVNGWFGIEADPLAAVYAILLAMPWSLLLGELDVKSEIIWINIALLAGGMLINLVLMFGIFRLLKSKFRGN